MKPKLVSCFSNDVFMHTHLGGVTGLFFYLGVFHTVYKCGVMCDIIPGRCTKEMEPS